MKKGFYGKYIIKKADGTDINENADYFVLRLDKDRHARKAALAYADSIIDENPVLAKDLSTKISGYNNTPDKKYYYDEEYDLIREVIITEVKTHSFRIEDDACFIGFVQFEELFHSVEGIMKYLNKNKARVSFMDGKAAREITI